MRLTASMVEAAFVATAREQRNGEPFDWRRCADHLNRFAARPPVGVDGGDNQPRPFLLMERGT